MSLKNAFISFVYGSLSVPVQRIIPGVFFTVFAFSVMAQSDKFELVRKENNIAIYERWITFPKSKPPVKAREVKGEFTITTSMEKAVALIRDEKRIRLWQKHVSEYKVFPANDSMWFAYSYHDIPWPVTDQDHFLVYTLRERIPGKEWFIMFETQTNDALAPARKHADRMVLAGSWRLQKISPSRIKVTYSILSMPSDIPRIFTDPVIRNNLMSTIKSYISLLEKK